MPFTYSIDLDQNLIHQTLWGPVTTAELRSLAKAIWADPLYRKRLNVLADLRNAVVDIPYDEMVEFAHFLHGKSQMGRQAIVVSRQLGYGMARMYEQLTEHTVPRLGLRVFFNMDEAEDWIGYRMPVTVAG